jgi:two-component system cell cycle response regulator
LKVLIAEDDRVTRRMLEVMLCEWGYEVSFACDGIGAWQKLQEPDAPRLALLDWVMPGMDGLEVCRQIRKDAGRPYTYILLVTSKGDRQHLLEGLAAGADDYLPKPFDVNELRARLEVGRRIVDLQNQLIAAREALREQATHDGLTGLWNRAAICDLLERELSRCYRGGGPVGVLLADLDHFKQINDSCGHLAGDAVLRQAALRMQAALRPYDSIGRYGGEEFLIVLPECDTHGAIHAGERVRLQLQENPLVLLDKHLSITVSVGAISTSSTSGQSVEAILRAVDAALYRAKNGGRNVVAGDKETGKQPSV